MSLILFRVKQDCIVYPVSFTQRNMDQHKDIPVYLNVDLGLCFRNSRKYFQFADSEHH